MHVSRWGNSLGVRIPSDVVRALSLKPGDEIEVTVRDGALEIERPPDRDAVIAEIRAMARPLPPGWKFNREQLYAREFEDE